MPDYYFVFYSNLILILIILITFMFFTFIFFFFYFGLTLHSLTYLHIEPFYYIACIHISRNKNTQGMVFKMTGISA